LLEVRFGENLTASRHLGLAGHAPRLAVFFVVFGLALVGLPGTLSFCSQDLLIHGTLASHPQTGLLLPIATALNAVSVFRLFTRLFLGRHRTGFTITADALPRERWILTAGVLFVVLGGLFPSAFVALQSAQAEIVDQANNRPAGQHLTADTRSVVATEDSKR
jgi:NADH-quinone oxidoreductase subunit M